MAERAPFNISLLDVGKYIKEHGTKEVTSAFIKESSSNRFHPGGLFSELIFGQIASEERSLTSGFMSLNCSVFHPIIFQNIVSIKRLYGEIMAGSTYVIWNQDEGDFERAAENEEGADTGYTFFMKHFENINFKSTASLRRSDKVEVVLKYKDTRLVDKIIVIPAGIRDIKDSTMGRMEKDSINSLYASLLANASAMPPGADKNPLFDTVHYIVQKKVNDIYEQLSTMVRGKGGFFEGKFYHRNIARGTRNVITASQMEAESPNSPQYHKVTETKVPLFQAAKAAANQLVYWYKSLFYDQILNNSSDNIPLINKDTLKLEYVPIDAKDKDRLLTSDGIEKTIDRFRDPFNRFMPASARVANYGSKPTYYYLFMVYDIGTDVYIFRNVDEFKARMKDLGQEVDTSKIRALTNAEMLYIATYFALQGTHGFVTRYPVTDEQSIYPSETHLMTTSPSRQIKLRMNIMVGDEEGSYVTLPEYPVIGRDFVDALMLHPTRLKSLGGDFDGNCVVGDTIIDIRYTQSWYDRCSKLLSGKDRENFGNTFAKHTWSHDEDASGKRTWTYAEIQIKDMPKVGTPCKDKNGADVYDLPEGLEVLSIKDNERVYLPVEKLTVEKNCEVATVTAGSKTCTLSSNASVAVFDHDTGGLKKVTPADAVALGGYIPFVIRPEKRSFGHTYHEGYSAAKKNVNNTVRALEIRSMGFDYIVGYICGIIDVGKEFVISNSPRGTLITYKPAADKQEEAKLLARLLYYAGVRSFEIIDKNIIRSIMVDAHSLIHTGVKISIKDERTTKFIERYSNTPSAREPQAFNVPITKEEQRELFKRVHRDGSTADIARIKKEVDLAFTTTFLKKFVSKTEDTPLAKRIYSEEVMWFKTTKGDLQTNKETVYDLIVPESKVFVANNGMVVFDTCSWTPVFSKEANEEISAYLKQPDNYILPSGDPIASMFDDLCKMSFFAMTRDSPEMEKENTK